VIRAALRQGGAAIVAAWAAPLAAAALAARPQWRVGADERLALAGEYDPGAVWLHGASVGEALLLTRLVPVIRKQGHRVQASLTTPGGRDTLRRMQPDVPVRLSPIDHPWPVAAAVARARPAALVLVETELWPSLIAAVSRRGVPNALLSGRLSSRAWPRYRRLRPLFSRTLQRIDRIGARTAEDAERFVALGADPKCVRVTGDLKREPAGPASAAALDLEPMLSGPLILVAGSTHASEERAAIAALEACLEAGLPAALVLAPRHIQRRPEVERELAASGLSWRRRSGGIREPLEPGDVLLLDTLGELASAYAYADLAFVGGSLVPVGGHNLLEPVQVGCPVLFGPYTDAVADMAAEIVEAGVGRPVGDAAELARACVEGLSGRAASGASPAVGATHLRTDALEQSLDLLREVLPEPSP
jgi:3-deoxy-D-manno-octulosonic-acid transferase